MGVKLRRKMKGGQAADDTAAVTLEGGQKLLNRYGGAAEENP